MRLATLAIISLAATGTPALAKSEAATETARSSCAASLQKANDTPGYKMVRSCDKADAVKAPSGLSVARAPVEGGSNMEGGSLVLSLFALGAIGAGIFIAADGGSDNAPASP